MAQPMNAEASISRERLIELLQPTAKELCCESYLEHCAAMARNPSAAQRQLDLVPETNDPRSAVERLVEEARITPRVA